MEILDSEKNRKASKLANKEGEKRVFQCEDLTYEFRKAIRYSPTKHEQNLGGQRINQ